MSYTIQNNKDRIFLVIIPRFFEIIYIILFSFFIVFIGPILLYNNEVAYGLAWILITIIFGIPVILLFEYGIRNASYKEAIINDDSVTLVKRNRKKRVTVPFKSIYRREVDEEGSIHYYTDLDFKPHPLFKRGTLSSNYIDDRIIEVIDRNINEELIK